MAIYKMSSQGYNEILENTIEKIEEMSDEMKKVKNDIFKKVKIIKHEEEYLSYLYEKASYSIKEEDNFIFLNKKYDGLYRGYSNVVHPYFKQDPINVFNLKVVNGKESYFRDEVKVSINGIEDDHFKNILKAEGVRNKEIFFEEYDVKREISLLSDNTPIENKNDKTEIVIEVDKEKALGSTKFNIIEIDPYLYKSFDIESIKIYTDDKEEPDYTISNIENIGKTRYVLDKKYDLKKVIFNIKHNYSTYVEGKEVFPFGLKHIFFLEADFRSDSYIIASYKSDSYIDDIKDKVEVISALNKRDSSLTEEGIKIYLSYENGVLSIEQEPSNDIKKPIARNLKTVYFKIPLKHEAMIGYKFLINKR